MSSPKCTLCGKALTQGNIPSMRTCAACKGVEQCHSIHVCPSNRVPTRCLKGLGHGGKHVVFDIYRTKVAW